MVLSLITFIVTIILMITMIIFKPNITYKKLSFQTFWVVTFLGALVVILTSQIDLSSLWSNLTTGKMNPIKILVLFISLSMISICLDELNFFNYLSTKALEKSKGNQYKIFFTIYFLVAILTIFTSNDIVILTFTPFIILFSKKAKINPLPYLICEFVNANTYSMLLSIGNPTNIYLASSQDISFIYYLSKMYLPTIFAGLSTLITILLIFRKDLSKKIEDIEIEEVKLNNKPLVIINLVILGLTTIMLVISNYILLEMWLICLSSLIILTLILLIYTLKTNNKTYLVNTYKRLPYNLIPFILSMFILVLSLKENGVINYLQNFLDILSVNKIAEGFTYTISSTLFDNIINNIPMSVLYSSLLEGKSELALFSTIIGSNIGAYLTPVGALAGIMWMSILKKHDLDFNFISFVKYGIILVPVSLIFSTLGILITCM
jgi:arsenical pump membrane protein